MINYFRVTLIKRNIILKLKHFEMYIILNLALAAICRAVPELNFEMKSPHLTGPGNHIDPIIFPLQNLKYPKSSLMIP